MVEVTKEEKVKFVVNDNELLKLQIRVSIQAAKPEGQRQDTGRLYGENAVNQPYDASFSCPICLNVVD
jgi:hypothetical protein